MYLVIGSATLDVFISGIEKMPVMEEDEFTVDNLVFTESPLEMRPGGNGANSAIVLGKLGAPVFLCSAIGRDTPGNLLTGWLQDAGVELHALKKSVRLKTSSTTVISRHHRNRLSFHYHGATREFGFLDLPKEILDAAEVLLLTGYPLLTGWRPSGVRQVLERAHQQNILTALDIGPAVGDPTSLEEIAPFLSAIDYLLCNEYELAVLCGTTFLEKNITMLHEAGPTTIVVKRGFQGAAVSQPGMESLLNVPAFRADAGFTVGAGDAFNAGLLFALRGGQALSDAIRFAQAVAVKVISSGEGVLSCPSLEEIKHFLTINSAEE